jgi:hypothetical protein
MLNTSDNIAAGITRQNRSCAVLDSAGDPTARSMRNTEHRPTFSKVFRWQPADPHDPTPHSVELAGSFTDWRAVEMTRDAVTNTWQATLHGIPGNRTHRYMLIVNGEPASDKNCDGLAVPEGFDEQKYQLMTVRGPRIFLLFAQTK